MLIGFICSGMGRFDRDQTFELSLLATYPAAGIEGKYYFTDSFGIGISPTVSWDEEIDFQVSIRPVVIVDLFMLKNTQVYLNTGVSVDLGSISVDSGRAFNVATSLPIGIGLAEPTKRFSIEMMIAPGI